MFVLKTWKNYWENNEEREHTLKSSKIRFWLKKLDGNDFCFHFWNLITTCHLCQVQNYCINLDNLAHPQYTQPSIHFKRRFFRFRKVGKTILFWSPSIKSCPSFWQDIKTRISAHTGTIGTGVEKDATFKAVTTEFAI